MDTRKLTYRTILGVMLLLPMLVACAGNEVPVPEVEPVPEQEDMLIRWDVQSEGMVDGRMLINDDTGLQAACTPGSGDEAIGIWSAYRFEGDSVKNVLGVNGDVNLVYNASTAWDNWEGWTYGEKAAFWKNKAVYYFNAYFPKVGSLTSIANDSTSLKGTYNAETTQTDLMVSRVKVDTNAETFQGSPVELPLKHALATLQFFFQMEGETATNVLKSFSLDNTLKTFGHLNFNTEDMTVGNWTNHQASSSGRIYEWSSDSGISFSASTSANPYAGNGNDGHVFIIPQHCNTAPTFSFESDLLSKEGVSMETTTFEPGKHYIYTIKMKGTTMDVTLRIKAWNELKSSHNIPL